QAPEPFGALVRVGERRRRPDRGVDQRPGRQAERHHRQRQEQVLLDGRDDHTGEPTRERQLTAEPTRERQLTAEPTRERQLIAEPAREHQLGGRGAQSVGPSVRQSVSPSDRRPDPWRRSVLAHQGPAARASRWPRAPLWPGTRSARSSPAGPPPGSGPAPPTSAPASRRTAAGRAGRPPPAAPAAARSAQSWTRALSRSPGPSHRSPPAGRPARPAAPRPGPP